MNYKDWGLFFCGATVLAIILCGILTWGEPSNPVALKIMLSVDSFAMLVTSFCGMMDYLTPEQYKRERHAKKLNDLQYEMMMNKVRDVDSVKEYAGKASQYTTLAQFLVKYEREHK